MKKVFKKIVNIIDSAVFFHIASSIILALSLTATFTTHKVSVYRIVNAVKSFGIGAWHWIKVNLLCTVDFDAPLPELPSIEFYRLLDNIPFNVDKLVYKMQNVFPALFNFERFMTYTYYFMYAFTLLLFVLIMVFEFVFIFKELISYSLKSYSKDHKQDTFCLKWYKRLVEKPVLSVVYRVIDFFKLFLSLNRYKIPFIIIWLLNLNVYSLALELVSRLLLWSVLPTDIIFILSSTGVFILDFIIMFFSAPITFWCSIALIVFLTWRKKWGYDKLDHLYRQDMGFLKSCGYNILLEGEIGASKTKNGVMISRMFDDLYHTDQWESMHECHLEYPDFPFYELQEEISNEMQEHLIFSLHTAREFAFYKMSIWLKNKVPENIYGYTGRMYYNDGCRYVSIWEMINDYCQLYFMYSNDTTSISSNISIRTNLVQVQGYFPLWDNKMIQREPELYDEYTRYCHILDNDAVRFGVPMDPNNKRIGSTDYGVHLHDEVDKDRGNQDTNKIYDASSNEANTLNDGFDIYLSFQRHLALIRFKNYSRNIAALQRDDNYKAREKSLFDRMLITGNLGTKFTIPFFFEYPIYKKIDSWFDKLDLNTYHFGNVHSLPYYLLLRIFSPFFNYCRRLAFQFGYDTHLIQRVKACNENNVQVHKLYTLHCIAHDNAYASDCYSLIADEIAKNVDIGMIDFPTYEGKYPQPYEFAMHHGYYANKQLKRIAKSRQRKQS